MDKTAFFPGFWDWVAPVCSFDQFWILQKWSSSWKALLSPQSNVGALLQWPSGSWSPPWLVRQRALGRVLLVYKRLPFRDEAAEFTGTSTPWYNPVTEISRQFTGLIVCRILRWKVNLIHFGVRLKWQNMTQWLRILSRCIPSFSIQFTFY